MRWEQRGSFRWVGVMGGRQVALVAEVVTAGGAQRYWFCWVDDRAQGGRQIGEFATAEEAMAAADAEVG